MPGNPQPRGIHGHRARALCVRIPPRGPPFLATTHLCGGPPAARGDPAMCFHTLHVWYPASHPPPLCSFSKIQGWPTLLLRQLNGWNSQPAPGPHHLSSPSPDGPHGRPRPSPGPRVAAELVHVWVILGQDGDSVTLLPNDEPGLLLRGAPQVYAIELGNIQSTFSDVAGAGNCAQEGRRGRTERRMQLSLTSSN